MDQSNNFQLPSAVEPIWRQGTDIKAFDSLNSDLKTRVAVIGGGLTGITTAYLLADAGIDAVLVEAGRLADGTTGHTTAKITAQHDVLYDEMIQHIGEEKARLYYEANVEALGNMKEIINKENLDCSWRQETAFLYGTSDEDREKLEKEAQAYDTLDINGRLEDENPELPFAHNILLSMKDQAQFNPFEYAKGLIDVFLSRGGKVFENTTAVDIENANTGHPVVITREGKRISADYVVLATHFPFYDKTGFYFARMTAERSYIVAAKIPQRYPGGMYLGIGRPTRSLRQADFGGEEVVLIGGESHKTGQGVETDFHYSQLADFGKEVFGDCTFIARWSAQDLYTLDKLPYIGPLTQREPHLLVATGYKKWGMTTAAAAAYLIRDTIQEKANPYHDLFSPARFYADPSLKKFFMNNLDVAGHLIKGKLETPTASIEDLAPDEGKIIHYEGARAGGYKTPDGTIHVVDTTCTHLGCEVEWNAGDRTWDCPCHGSRYKVTGEVVEGPAKKPLKKLK